MIVAFIRLIYKIGLPINKNIIISTLLIDRTNDDNNKNNCDIVRGRFTCPG